MERSPDASENLADHFLHKGQTIVTHHGRASEETKFAAKHGERGRQMKLERGWKPDEAMVDEFRAYAAKRGYAASDEEFRTDRDWVREHLREEMLVTAFSKEESEKVALENDPEIGRALSAIPASRALLDHAGKVMARKSGGSGAAE
jgi:hypothetical protein